MIAIVLWLLLEATFLGFSGVKNRLKVEKCVWLKCTQVLARVPHLICCSLQGLEYILVKHICPLFGDFWPHWTLKIIPNILPRCDKTSDTHSYISKTISLKGVWKKINRDMKSEMASHIVILVIYIVLCKINQYFSPGPMAMAYMMIAALLAKGWPPKPNLSHLIGFFRFDPKKLN